MEHRGREREGTRDGMGRMREPLSYVHRVPRAVTIPLAVVRRDRARAGRALARVPCILVRCRLVPEPNVHAAGRGLSMLAARSRTSACDSGDERSLSTAVRMLFHSLTFFLFAPSLRGSTSTTGSAKPDSPRGPFTLSRSLIITTSLFLGDFQHVRRGVYSSVVGILGYCP